MFERITPEEAGVSSRKIARMLSFLERGGVVLHSMLLMKGDKVFGEYYWKPFDEHFCHRMYSETKSYVGIAIGLLLTEGKLSLDDPILSYFPDKLDCEPFPHLGEQTVRDMLTMRTGASAPNWFRTEDPDRVHEYLNASKDRGIPGTIWQYDSAGSQVLCALVERLSGMSLFDYLNERIFRHLGTFRTAEMLKTPNGDTWGDSALLCTTRDMASFVRLLMKGGLHEGKQLIDAGYVAEACSRVTDNHEGAFTDYSEFGYGYQIWRCFMDGFSFHGMGGQFSIAIPKKDLTIITTGDTQGHKPTSAQLLFSAVEEFIALDMTEEALPEDPDGVALLRAQTADLKLAICPGETDSPYQSELNGKVYDMAVNPFGWKWFSFDFGEDGTGTLRYENAQGEKTLPIAFGRNVFCKFPQLGYSDGVGGEKTENGFCYRCASSTGWLSETLLACRVQVIDRYFGNLFMRFSFKGDGVDVVMVKNAEAFLDEYNGRATGKRREKSR